jgi:hypothetical protein
MGLRDSASDQQRPYLLSEEDHHYYYREFIQNALLEVSISSVPSIAYFLGAQPGSGKTKLATIRERPFSQEEQADFDITVELVRNSLSQDAKNPQNFFLET